ncbi:NLR family CARD domain-containing protein 3-like isoform X2 [Hypomesus transpacificus]|uniref:NLR family CARD domain-containing protein 3-like isoform X2 n=1 Tax=Hypomesus transpacificus TaxID=137520 RepID=UPI001F072EFD|nr:NLR family CARD domain-containing protein 3-like isoform X2 [Hypomesus transpacificus]
MTMQHRGALSPRFLLCKEESISHHMIQPATPSSPAPSCVSIKSDKSMDRPYHFNKDVSTDKIQPATPSTPAPSCVSIKSDKSMDRPYHFNKDVSTDKIQPATPSSPAPSCVSIKSDKSMDRPYHFNKDVSTDNDMQGSLDLEMNAQCQNMDLSSVFRVLEDNIITFVRSELKAFKNILSPGFESLKDDELVNSDDIKLESSAREGALKITLTFLKNMNQKHLADVLEKSILGELAVCQQKLKLNMKKRFEHVFEGIANQGNPTYLNKIYTELYITEGKSGEVNNEHEVRQIEAAFSSPGKHERAIKCNDIFQPSLDQDTSIRTVLTMGVAGIGKTVSSQKFMLDWAEGRANHDIQLIFALPFRDLNMMCSKKQSLREFLDHFFIETKECGISDFGKHNILFVFDGLDECRLPLDFQNNTSCCDITESASVDMLLTNLIKGNLVPSAHIWITSRPAATCRVPPECVDPVTEIQGFNDPQKEEYIRKTVSDQSLACRIITHVKSSRSLYIMCHIPIFTWISAKVLQKMLSESKSEEMPKTLTQMYSHFLISNILIKQRKYSSLTEKVAADPQNKMDEQMIIKLGKLAFEQLQKGNLIFYEEDLRECGIDVREASVFSGMCTEIFRKEYGLYQEKVFCFVHLTIQEFLAALYVFYTFNNRNINLMAAQDNHRQLEEPKDAPITVLHSSAIDKALDSENGHLDLVLRFLLGLSMQSNHTLISNLLPQTGSCPHSNEDTIYYIKEKIRKTPSPERCINLFHCLNELNDHSLVEEIQSYLSSGSLSEAKLSPAQWSALVFVLLTSEEKLDVFDLKKYSRCDEGFLRLMPVVKSSRTALLNGCNLTMKCCDVLASVLSSKSSLLRMLDLSDNDLQDEGVHLLATGLGSPQCKLETLKLSFCGVTQKGCASLALALKSNPSHLSELDLSYNHLGEFGERLLSAGLEDPLFQLRKLSVENGEECWLKSGLKKYACELTLDPNTTCRHISLTENNTKMTRGKEVHPYPDHPERFRNWGQVLCKEGLTGQCYWEVEWTGTSAGLGVAYKGTQRKGEGNDCALGYNDQSWSLRVYDNSYNAWHNRKGEPIVPPSKTSQRVGVYLDWPAGTLSFYSVSDTLTHLHTFHTTFTEPLYPGFRVWHDYASVSLCKVEK